MSRFDAALAVALVWGVFNGACTNKKNPDLFGGQAGTAASSSLSLSPAAGGWASLFEQATCGTGNPDSCLGAYGFRVYSNRSLVAGPPPGGGIVSGIIEGSELETLDQDVGALTATDLNSPLVCHGAEAAPGFTDKVVLNNGRRDFIVYEGSSVSLHGSDCTIADSPKAEKLHSDLRALMREYYPVPYPEGGIAMNSPQ